MVFQEGLLGEFSWYSPFHVFTVTKREWVSQLIASSCSCAGRLYPGISKGSESQKHWPNTGWTLSKRLWRWFNVDPALSQSLITESGSERLAGRGGWVTVEPLRDIGTPASRSINYTSQFVAIIELELHTPADRRVDILDLLYFIPLFWGVSTSIYGQWFLVIMVIVATIPC